MGFMIYGTQILFFIAFTLILIVIMIQVFKSISTWNKNNHSPRLIVDAKIISKRTEIIHHHHSHGGNHNSATSYHTSSSTIYYICFEFNTGDRMEFKIPREEYGLFIEGDLGKLTFQGTRYLGFERE